MCFVCFFVIQGVWGLAANPGIEFEPPQDGGGLGWVGGVGEAETWPWRWDAGAFVLLTARGSARGVQVHSDRERLAALDQARV